MKEIIEAVAESKMIAPLTQEKPAIELVTQRIEEDGIVKPTACSPEWSGCQPECGPRGDCGPRCEPKTGPCGPRY